MSQSLEFFIFGGRNRSHLAGKCKLAKKHVDTAALATKSSKYSKKKQSTGLDDSTPSSPVNPSEPAILRQVSFESNAEDQLYEPLQHRHSIDQDVDRRIIEVTKKRFSTMREIATSISSSKETVPTLKPLSMISTGSKAAAVMEWTCVTCAQFNREPRHPEFEPEIKSQSVGQLYTRTFAVLKYQRDIPRCKKCFTDADYIPSKTTAHLFRNYRERYYAFSNYPVKVEQNVGLSRNKLSVIYYKLSSFFFGTYHDVDSLLLHNDWRMRKYLPSKFQEITRPFKAPNEYFKRGEIIESTHQKVQWTRGKIITVRSNRTYDIT